MKKNSFLKNMKGLSREELREIKGGGAGQNADSCIALGGACGATILACCPGTKCVFIPRSFFGTCKAD